ncbi:MAG: HEAT repeat domain-containing protein [Pseudohongiellaceae bacterium]
MKKLSSRIRTALAIVLSFSIVQAHAAEEDSSAYRQGYSLVIEQRWEEAQRYFSEFMDNRQGSEFADDAGYWHCYSEEQIGNDAETQFGCYGDFIEQWRETGSNWLDDARERLVIIAHRLASQGRPQFIPEVLDYMDRPELPELPDLPGIDAERIRQQVERGLARAQDQLRALEDQDWRAYVDHYRGFSPRTRRSVDSELLGLLTALRGNPRAGEILVERLNTTDDPQVKARLVLMLEDIEGSEVTGVLIDLARNSPDEAVRRNAVLALLDRDDEEVVNLLREIVLSPDYPVTARSAAISAMDDWDQTMAIRVLDELLRSETNTRLIGRAARQLMELDTDTARGVLTQSYAGISDSDLRRSILDEMDDSRSPDLIGFFTEIALGDNETEAAVAVENLASREDDMGVAALDHIYNNTTSERLRLAVIHGMGESETRQAVEFLRQLATQADDSEVLTAVVRGLGRADLREAVPAVIAVYRGSDDEAVRSEAVRSMRRLREFPEAQEFMLEMLEQELDAL